MVESRMKQTVQNQHLGGDWLEEQSYQKENTDRSTHKRGKKNLLIFLKKCEKAGEEDTVRDRWKMSHETMKMIEISERILSKL